MRIAPIQTMMPSRYMRRVIVATSMAASVVLPHMQVFPNTSACVIFTGPQRGTRLLPVELAE